MLSCSTVSTSGSSGLKPPGGAACKVSRVRAAGRAALGIGAAAGPPPDIAATRWPKGPRSHWWFEKSGLEAPNLVPPQQKQRWATGDPACCLATRHSEFWKRFQHKFLCQNRPVRSMMNRMHAHASIIRHAFRSARTPMVCAHRAPLSLVSLLSVSLSYAPETLRPSRFLSLEHPPFHASCGWLCHRLRNSTASHLRLPDVCNQRGT